MERTIHLATPTVYSAYDVYYYAVDINLAAILECQCFSNFRAA